MTRRKYKAATARPLTSVEATHDEDGRHATARYSMQLELPLFIFVLALSSWLIILCSSMPIRGLHSWRN